METCPRCGSMLHTHRWQTLSTERSGAYTLFSFVTSKCSANCGYAKMESVDQKRVEHA
jgi:hypothetical protein